MVGEARLTAHGSAGGALVGGGAAVAGESEVPGAAEGAVEAGLVPCGVLATVESPDPQPANVTVTATVGRAAA